LRALRGTPIRSWFACTLAVLPAFGLACDLSERKACEKRIVALVEYRSEAIQHAGVPAALRSRTPHQFNNLRTTSNPARGAIRRRL